MLSLWLVTFAPTLAAATHSPFQTCCSMVNPLSPAALSIQVSLTVKALTGVAVSVLGPSIMVTAQAVLL
ncbi:MAG: hypothetical protein A2010_07630 [Nitrospirae bacterium GWD2_57_9]|nr:MAG: hypothetical protein A2010_07630 [Nitrospirae bacterium GWD2_57_9]